MNQPKNSGINQMLFVCYVFFRLSEAIHYYRKIELFVPNFPIPEGFGDGLL